MTLLACSHEAAINRASGLYQGNLMPLQYRCIAATQSGWRLRLFELQPPWNCRSVLSGRSRH